MITVVSWNIGRRLQSVEELLAMEADVSLLQEVGPGALEALKKPVVMSRSVRRTPGVPGPGQHYDRWPMVVKLSDRVKVEWFRQILPTAPEEQDDEIAVSNVGIIAAAGVIPLVQTPSSYR